MSAALAVSSTPAHTQTGARRGGSDAGAKGFGDLVEKQGAQSRDATRVRSNAGPKAAEGGNTAAVSRGQGAEKKLDASEDIADAQSEVGSRDDAADPVALLLAVVAPATSVPPTGDGDADDLTRGAADFIDGDAPSQRNAGQAALTLVGPDQTLNAGGEGSQPGSDGDQPKNRPAIATGPAPAFAEHGTAGDAQPTVATRATSASEPGTEVDAGPRSASSAVQTMGALDQKVTVASVQVAPAPAAVAPPSPTGVALVASIQADGTLTRYVSDVASVPFPTGDARPVTTLKLQLHPAELGNVTVTISGRGDDLAIDVQVENTEARHRLTADSEAITRSLRGLGYDIDRITVQQVAPAANAGQQQGASGGRGDGGFSTFDQRGERGQSQQQSSSNGQGHDQDRPAAQGIQDRAAAAGAVYI